ncbi:MAG: response regulator [Campylobacterota bacterium]|nr:response regulator [Campylobacterota bacterium]
MYEVNSSKYNILCVDDNENNLFTLKALLKTIKNVQSIEVPSAKDALDVLLKKKINLILLDIQMPDMNGFELAKILKSNKKTKDIPIIFITAVFKNDEFVKEGFEIGAVDYLTKPIDDNALLNKLSLYIKIFEQKDMAIQNQKRFYDIAQSIGDGIYTLDKEYKTTFINETALSILGFSERELLGKVIHNYIHYKDINNNTVSAQDCKVHKVIHSAKERRYEEDVFIKKDGSFVHVSLHVTPLFEGKEVVGSVTVFHDKSKEHKIISLESEKLKNQEQIIYSMVDMIERRDSYTAGHTRRVAHYCELIATNMNYAKDDIEKLKKAAWLHDLGKISTPDTVLLKPGKLSELEYTLIQEHLTSGYEMLSKVDQYKEIAEIMREHHEKFDGSGYPRGLSGNEILPLSRIMIVADAFDAMTTNRVYKSKKSVKEALQELQDLSSKHFHSEVVYAAMEALKDVVIDDAISQEPLTKMEQARFSYFYVDSLTHLFKVKYIHLILKNRVTAKNFYTYKIQLHNFSTYNKEFSWEAGNKILECFATELQEMIPGAILFRIEGDDFLAISEEKLELKIEDIKSSTCTNLTTIDVTCEKDYIENSAEAIDGYLNI